MSELTPMDFTALANWKEEKWVVLTPSGKSELGDILFKTNPYGLMLQIFGGLGRHKVMLITDDEKKATDTAQLLIDVQNGVAQEAIKQVTDCLREAHDWMATRNLGENADRIAKKMSQVLLVVDSRW